MPNAQTGKGFRLGKNQFCAVEITFEKFIFFWGKGNMQLICLNNINDYNVNGGDGSR